MAVIKVDHDKLRTAATAITSYCGIQDREMKAVDADIKGMLYADWMGFDAQEFGKKWEGVDARGATIADFNESFRNFASALTACANEYQDAQENVYYEASKL